VFSTSGGVLIIVVCMASFEGELTSLVEFGVYFYLPYFRGGVIFAIEKACILVAAILSLGTWYLPSL
jgi:hypothetical protein